MVKLGMALGPDRWTFRWGGGRGDPARPFPGVIGVRNARRDRPATMGQDARRPETAHAPEDAMRSRTEYLTMNVPARRGFVNLTPQVERVVRESGVQEGLVLVNAMHITASVFIN